MTQKTAVLYARYSSDKQREASIDDQLRVCRKYCGDEGIEVVAEYKDYALSGKTDHRPEFRRMIANAPESDYVVVYMFDRFSRDRLDSAAYKKALRDCGVRVVSATEPVEDTPEGGLHEGLMELLSEYYVKDLARKVRRGMEGNALKAQDNGYRIYGYSTDPATRRYVVNEAEAADVREVFSRRVSGESINSIAAHMAEKGCVTSTGRPVDFNWVKRVLTRKAYTGVYSWGGIEVPGGMPEIIDEITFQAAQKVISGRTRKQPGWEPYRLTGKLYCGFCGLPMHGYAGRGKNGRRYRYYGCKEVGGCGRPGTRADILEDAIAAAVIEVCDDEEKMRTLAGHVMEAYAEPGEEDAEIESARQRLKTLEREQHNISQAAMRGLLTDEMVERNREIDTQMRGIRNRLNVLAEQKMEITEEDIVGYMMHGFNREDEDFIFGSIVREVFLFADCAVLTFNFRNEIGDLEETRVELERYIRKNPNPGGFGSQSSGVRGKELPQTVILHGGFGIVVPIRRAA